jgi:hypothetical protein
VSVLVESARRLRVLPNWKARPQPYCQVCFAPQTRPVTVHDPLSGAARAVRLCPRCRYIEIPDPDLCAVPAGGWPHRQEGVMARLGADLLGRSELSVLLVRQGAAGAAVDLSGLVAVRRVNTAAFGATVEGLRAPHLPADDRFDVVVAADVVGQFRDPHADFGQLFWRVEEAGVLICSATIYDGGDLDRQRYLFGRSHASYYSPESLQRIAAAHQLELDIRTPTGQGNHRRRRRYLVFSRSNARLRGDCGKPLHH